MTLAKTETNRSKLAQLQAALDCLLSQALRRGFFGTAAVELAIQDGTIQQVRRRLECVDR